MAIKFACPYCDKISSVPDSFAGKRGKCPACNKVIEVPDPHATAEAPTTADATTLPPPSPASPPAAAGGDDLKPCQFCGERIKSVAKKCKFCGEFLEKGLKQARGGSRGPKPDNHLVLAIISTVLCGCMPLGIVSIVYASQVDSKYNAGDLRGAQDASRKAKTFAFWSMGVYFAFMFLYVVMAIVVGASGR